jgi:redox-sensitive bicupin YhaK (pirin superfamily)
MSTRKLQRVIQAVPTSDGAGVKLRRSLGQSQDARLDPFLMLDHFSTDQADDYIAGFPPHPHRGFETVTYMLDGHMQHKDHLGNTGELKSGAVQWMTAGRGIIHSEMPQQEQGRMRGFQLWINLPAKEKMKTAAYRDISPTKFGRRTRVAGGSGHCRRVDAGGRRIEGPIRGSTTDPLYLDVSCRRARLQAADPDRRQRLRLPVRRQRRNCAAGAARRWTHDAGVLGDGVSRLTAGPQGARMICSPAGRCATGRAVRSLRDEYPRGDRTGYPRLPERRAGLSREPRQFAAPQ